MRIKILRPPQNGFSLAEVTLAIGVCAFALMALVGMLSIMMGVDRSSEDETKLPTMTEQALEEIYPTLFPEPFPDGTLTYPAGNFSETDSELKASQAFVVYEFSQDGALLKNPSRNHPDAVYECYVHIRRPTSEELSDRTQSDPASGLNPRVFRFVRLDYYWPKGRSTDLAPNASIQTSLARK